MTPGMKRGLMIFAIGGVLLAMVGVVGWLQPQAPQSRAPQPTAVKGETVPIGGAFTLIDQDGRTVTDQTYRGKWLVVFFGFTHCPDVCPTALNDMSLVLDALGPRGEALQPLFITVDPERDTAEFLRDFTAAFHPRIVGLTGTPAQIEEAAKAYRVYYKKVPQGESYTMDHSAITYVIGPDGRFVTHFSHQTGVEKMTAKLRELLP